MKQQPNKHLNEALLILVSKKFEVPEKAICSTSRKVAHVQARWVYWKMLWDKGINLQNCAEATGHKDHTTVINALDNLPNYITQNWLLKQRVIEIETMLEQFDKAA